MNHLLMSFADPASSTPTYKLVCRNDSTKPWVFYIYQQNPDGSPDGVSLAWLASPYRIAPGAYISFAWDTSYCFVWADSGELNPEPGVVYSAGGLKPCNAAAENITTFSDVDNTPDLSSPVTGGVPGSLTIQVASSVPAGRFLTGIGMSGQSVYMVKAMPNLTQVYTPYPQYYIGAADQMQIGEVVVDVSTASLKFDFPPACYTLYATLDAQQEWAISQTP